MTRPGDPRAKGEPDFIDRERLAVAMHASYERDPSMKRIEWTDLNEVERRMWLNHAAAVVDLYEARTSTATPHENTLEGKT